jgi:hypothetical protein
LNGMTTINDFPPELFHLIFGHLRIKNIKECRLVNKLWCQHADIIVFNHISIMESSLDHLDANRSAFASLIEFYDHFSAAPNSEKLGLIKKLSLDCELFVLYPDINLGRIERLFGTSTTIKTLRIDNEMRPIYCSWSFTRKSLQNFRHLDLNSLELSLLLSLDGVPILQDFIRIVSSWKNLNELSIDIKDWKEDDWFGKELGKERKDPIDIQVNCYCTCVIVLIVSFYKVRNVTIKKLKLFDGSSLTTVEVSSLLECLPNLTSLEYVSDKFNSLRRDGRRLDEFSFILGFQMAKSLTHLSIYDQKIRGQYINPEKLTAQLQGITNLICLKVDFDFLLNLTGSIKTISRAFKLKNLVIWYTYEKSMTNILIHLHNLIPIFSKTRFPALKKITISLIRWDRIPGMDEEILQDQDHEGCMATTWENDGSNYTIPLAEAINQRKILLRDLWFFWDTLEMKDMLEISTMERDVRLVLDPSEEKVVVKEETDA